MARSRFLYSEFSKPLQWRNRSAHFALLVFLLVFFCWFFFIFVFVSRRGFMAFFPLTKMQQLSIGARSLVVGQVMLWKLVNRMRKERGAQNDTRSLRWLSNGFQSSTSILLICFSGASDSLVSRHVLNVQTRMCIGHPSLSLSLSIVLVLFLTLSVVIIFYIYALLWFSRRFRVVVACRESFYIDSLVLRVLLRVGRCCRRFWRPTDRPTDWGQLYNEALDPSTP